MNNVITSQMIHPRSTPTVSHAKLVLILVHLHSTPAVRQPRANESEYAALQRMVGTLQETLLRLREGQQVAAQQMQNDFTLKLQLAQTRFT